MKPRQSIIAGFIAVSAAFFGIAHAQPGAGCNFEGQGGRMAHHGMRHGDPARFVEHRLDRLKSDLKITPQQEPLWQAFAETSKGEMDKGAKQMEAMREGSGEKLTAPERMSRMREGMKERLAALENVDQSFKRLYESLSPEQKAAADQHFSRMGQRMGAMGGKRGPAGSAPGTPPAAR
jgi:hypothetical protein